LQAANVDVLSPLNFITIRVRVVSAASVSAKNSVKLA